MMTGNNDPLEGDDDRDKQPVGKEIRTGLTNLLGRKQ
jgi:hypothetical protein